MSLESPVQEATFILANGEEIRVTLDLEGPMGAAPQLKLRVAVMRGTLVVLPSSNNAIDITTKKALTASCQQVDKAVEARDADKAKRQKN